MIFFIHPDQTVSLDVGKLIMQGRQQKGMSQKDLATVRLVFYDSLDHIAMQF